MSDPRPIENLRQEAEKKHEAERQRAMKLRTEQTNYDPAKIGSNN